MFGDPAAIIVRVVPDTQAVANPNQALGDQTSPTLSPTPTLSSSPTLSPSTQPTATSTHQSEENSLVLCVSIAVVVFAVMVFSIHD
jgi:hypothetical protein